MHYVKMSYHMNIGTFIFQTSSGQQNFLGRWKCSNMHCANTVATTDMHLLKCSWYS